MLILGPSGYEIYIFLEKNGKTIGKQWRLWSDAAFCGVWSGLHCLPITFLRVSRLQWLTAYEHVLDSNNHVALA